MCGENRKHGFEAEGGKVTFRSTVTVIDSIQLKGSVNKARAAIATTGNDRLDIMVSQLAKTVFDVPIFLTRI